MAFLWRNSEFPARVANQERSSADILGGEGGREGERDGWRGVGMEWGRVEEESGGRDRETNLHSIKYKDDI